MVMENIIQKINNEDKKILIIGDIMVDIYKYGQLNRLSKEVKKKYIFDTEKEELKLGGAGNLWSNLKGFYVGADLCGYVGYDIFGDYILKQLDNKDYIIRSSYPSIQKCRYYVNNKQVFRSDKEEKIVLSQNVYSKLFLSIKENIDNYSLVFISDYKKGFCEANFISKIIDLCNDKNIPIYVDSKDIAITKYSKCNLLKLNQFEFYNVFGFKYKQNKNYNKKIYQFLKDNQINFLLISLGKNGVVLYSDKSYYHSKVKKIKIADVVGAGDCLDAAISVCKINKISEIDSLSFINKCASYSVTKIGTNVFDYNNFLKEFYYE